MRKGIATEIVARRLGIERGRADGLVQAASDAGLLPKASGRARPDLGPHDLANLFIAVVADNGLGNVPATVRTFGALSDDAGRTLHAALTGLFGSQSAAASASIGSLIIRLDTPTGALIAGGIHSRFGPEPPPGAAGRHVVVPGQTLAAIALELQGYSPDEADEHAALARIASASWR